LRKLNNIGLFLISCVLSAVVLEKYWIIIKESDAVEYHLA